MKKSRALSTPAEVDENDNDEEEFADALENDVPTPSPQPSPPLETKTRQLSQGADDNALRNGQIEREDSADAAPAPLAPDNAATPDAQPQIGTSSFTPAATTPKMQNQTNIVEISAPGGVAAKGTIEETATTTSVEHVAAPLPAAAVPTVTEQVLVRPTTSAMPIPQSEAQCTQKIDNQTGPVPIAEARADSNPRDVKRPTPPLSEGDCTAKRPREDEDGNLDPNPREAKRASPPPEKEKEKEKEKKERPPRKKSVADAHAQSTPASPRATPASAFVGCLSPSLSSHGYANTFIGRWRLPCICVCVIALRGRKRSWPLRPSLNPHKEFHDCNYDSNDTYDLKCTSRINHHRLPSQLSAEDRAQLASATRCKSNSRQA